jgi:multisubunit Na+/H+ antiporter MnhF subunit
MNVWELAAEVLMVALFPLAWSALRAEPRLRLVSFYMTGIVIVLLILLLTMAFNRMPLMDLALTLALMSFGGGIVFARFFARHLD